MSKIPKYVWTSSKKNSFMTILVLSIVENPRSQNPIESRERLRLISSPWPNTAFSVVIDSGSISVIIDGGSNRCADQIMTMPV